MALGSFPNKVGTEEFGIQTIKQFSFKIKPNPTTQTNNQSNVNNQALSVSFSYFKP